MGFGIKFAGSIAIGKPPDMTEEECTPLHCLITRDIGLGYNVFISCWEMTDEEMEQIIKTKKVWLKIFASRLPPTNVTGIKYPEVIEEERKQN